jgi:hypothetical protein
MKELGIRIFISFTVILIALGPRSNLLQAAQQDTTAIVLCQPFGDPMTCVLQIMRGAPYDSVKQYIDPDAYVITGRTCQPLTAVLQQKDRASILGCDSTRTGWLKYTSDTAGDAMCFTIESIGISDGQKHYHSVGLYKKPHAGWQICLWHVGE